MVKIKITSDITNQIINLCKQRIIAIEKMLKVGDNEELTVMKYDLLDIMSKLLWQPKLFSGFVDYYIDNNLIDEFEKQLIEIDKKVGVIYENRRI